MYHGSSIHGKLSFLPLRLERVGYRDSFSINMTANKTYSVNFTASRGGGGGSGGGGSGGGSGSGGGGYYGSGGYSITGSASSVAGLWNILVWLSVPAFLLAIRIRRR